jgi:hypothetical protein
LVVFIYIIKDIITIIIFSQVIMPTICDIVYNYSCIVVSGHVDNRFWVDLWVWMSKSLWYLLLPPKSWIFCCRSDFKKKREKTTESTQSESENFWSCQFHSHHCTADLQLLMYCERTTFQVFAVVLVRRMTSAEYVFLFIG